MSERYIDRSRPVHFPGCPGMFNPERCECSPMPRCVEPFTLGPVTLLPFRLELKQCQVRPAAASRPAHLHLSAEVIHRDTGEVTDITVHSELPYPLRDAPVSIFAGWLRSQLVSLLVHELDEVLLVNGERFKDPHVVRR